MIHEYKYEVTLELQRACMRDYFFSMVLKKRWIVIIIFVLLSVLFLASGEEYETYGYVISAVTGLIVIGWIKSYMAHMRMATTQYEMLEDGHITLGLDEEGIHYRSANGDKFFAWNKLNGIKESKLSIYLMRGKTPMVTIPKHEIDEEGVTMLRSLNSSKIGDVAPIDGVSP